MFLTDARSLCSTAMHKRSSEAPKHVIRDEPVLIPPFGQMEPSDKCRIKGNISDKGERIYHVLGSSSYEKTRITSSKGERWFCTEDEARKAGWRAPKAQSVPRARL